MSAAARSLLTLPAAEPRRIPPPYLGAAEAATLLGISPRHVCRRCVDEWGPSGLAKNFSGVWGIHPSADLKLAGVESWTERDLRQHAALRKGGTRPRAIEKALAVRDLIAEAIYFIRENVAKTEAECFEIVIAKARAEGRIGDGAIIRKMQPGSLRKLRDAYAKPGEAGGLAALIDSNGKTGGADSIGKAAWDFAWRLLTAGNGITAGTAYKVTQAHRMREGLIDDPAWKLPGLRTFQKACKDRITRPMRIMCDLGPRKFDALCIPKGQRDYEKIAAGDCYIGDERHLDVLIRIPDDRHTWRPHRGVKLTAWIDERSRYIVGWIMAPFANSDTILGSLKRAIRAHGLPLGVRKDNGKDYDKATGPRPRWNRNGKPSEQLSAPAGDRPSESRELTLFRADDAGSPAPATDQDNRILANADAVRRLRNVLTDFGIGLQTATPYMPWAKSIESFFGTMKEHFDKLIVSYIGGNPTERHQDRHAWAKKNPHLLPTLEEVAAMFAGYLDQYHSEVHTGHGMMGCTPAEALVKFRAGPPRIPTDDVLEFTFLSFTEPKLVRRDGVRHLKSWYGWGEPRLVALQGQKVILGIHPDNAGNAWVCDLDRKPLFRVESERHRFSTKRDAERIARTRSLLRAEYSVPARAARGFLIDTATRHLTNGKQIASAGEPHRQPRLILTNPELSNAIQTAAAKPFESPLVESPDGADRITLEDILDDDGYYAELQEKHRQLELAREAEEAAQRAELFGDDCEDYADVH